MSGTPATAPYGPVVLSPHADDAVWSLGGRLARWAAEGPRPTVVTVFAGPAAGKPESWRSAADPAVRRAEDRAACAELGVRHVPLGFTDAALRTASGAYLYASPRRLFGPWHPADLPLLEEVRAALLPLCAGASSVHVPLAAGRHVDHRLVRGAVEPLSPARTVFYEDFPYRLRERDHTNLRPRTERLPSEAVDRWLTAAGHYSSQASAHFGGAAALREALFARARAHGGPGRPGHADRHWVPVGQDDRGEARPAPVERGP
uniref:MitC n=1 Tax=Streptomyces lavendulae TaxID=1914 RepID=Q9WVY1_STRLA|nr:unknown [Streptomyces lavendulae]AAD32721.1 MitC [Streptomyces lavendulae]